MNDEALLASAIQSYLNGDFTTIQEAADAYGIDVSLIQEVIGL